MHPPSKTKITKNHIIGRGWDGGSRVEAGVDNIQKVCGVGKEARDNFSFLHLRTLVHGILFGDLSG